MAATHHKGPPPLPGYPIKTPSLRSLAPKEERKQQNNDKSTLKLFGLDEASLAAPAVPRFGAEPNALKLLAPPNVNAAPPPLRKNAPVITVRGEAPAPARARQRPSIAWLAFTITLLTFGWWVLFRSPPSTTATAPSAAPSGAAVNGTNRSAGEPSTVAPHTEAAAPAAPAAPTAQVTPQPVAAYSVPANEQAPAPADIKAAAAAPAAATAPAAKSTTGTASTVSSSKSSLVGKTAAPSTAKSSTSAPTKSAASSNAGSFDTAAARAALSSAAASASSCRQLGDPAGTAKVMVTFAPSGRVTSSVLAGGIFAGTRAGGCIAARMRSARVPPFSGSPVTVSKSVTIR